MIRENLERDIATIIEKRAEADSLDLRASRLRQEANAISDAITASRNGVPLIVNVTRHCGSMRAAIKLANSSVYGLIRDVNYRDLQRNLGAEPWYHERE